MGGNFPPEETPKTIPELMAEQHKELFDKIEPIALRANALPKAIDSDADLELVTPVVLDAKDLSAEIEKARGIAKKPYWDAGKEVDATFKALTTRLDRISSVFQKLASDYQTRVIKAKRDADLAEARRVEAAAQKLRDEAATAKRPETAERKLDQAEGMESVADRHAASASRSNAEVGKIQTAGGTASARTNWAASIEDFDAIDLNKIKHFIPRDAIEKGLAAYVKIQKEGAKMEGVLFFEDVKTSFRR
jgi:hypothetical protein